MSSGGYHFPSGRSMAFEWASQPISVCESKLKLGDMTMKGHEKPINSRRGKVTGDGNCLAPGQVQSKIPREISHQIECVNITRSGYKISLVSSSSTHARINRPPSPLPSDLRVFPLILIVTPTPTLPVRPPYLLSQFDRYCSRRRWAPTLLRGA